MMTMTRWIGVAVAALCAGQIARAAPPDVHRQFVAVTGRPATGGSAFIDVGNILTETPVLNDRGEALFVAFTGTPTEPIGGLFHVDANGNQRRLASDGDILPGAGGLFIGTMISLGIDNVGNFLSATIFVDELFNPDPPIAQAGVLLESDGTLQVLARDGQARPDGANWDSVLLLPELNIFGDVLLSDQGDGASGPAIFMYHSDTGFDTVFNPGTVTPPGHTVPLEAAFAAQFAGPGRAIFLGASGIGTPAVRSGYFTWERGAGVTQLLDAQNLTGPSGERVTGIGIIHANNLGEVAFTGDVPDVDPLTVEVLFTADANGNLTERFRVGDTLPGAAQPVDDIAVEGYNDTGQVILTVEHSIDDALVLYDPTDGATIIAEEGDQTPDGVGRFDEIFQIEMNEHGQVAFLASTTDSATSEGIYFYDRSFGLVELVESGDAMLGGFVDDLTFDVSSGSFDIEQRRGLNDLAQVALRLTLDNGGSALAVFTVPEPATAGLTIAGAIFGTGRRNRYPSPTRKKS
ncbi:MAG: hypothetical protein CMJ18_12895 [Phycisphaeraceae bacterium]|nr:hypothetical protein [Phycisphaeraceae bacterium]